MCTTKNDADATIERLISKLVDEFNADGFFTSPSQERKNEIIDQVAKLRKSMEPTIIQTTVS